jgi:hypothetical protein
MFKQFLKVLLVAAVVLAVFCGMSFAQGNRDAAFERVRQVHARNTNRLLAIKGIQGSAVGMDLMDRPVVMVFAAGHGIAGIPDEIDDIPVQVVVTGEFYAMAKPDNPGNGKGGGGGDKEKVDPTSRFARPVPIGVSTGNANHCSAGTIGCRVIDGDGNGYALSNNHVFALENTAQLDDEIIQPGLIDTGCTYDPLNSLGRLSAYVQIGFGEENTVDAAIASVPGGNLGNSTPSDGYGTPKSTSVAAEVNQSVQKYGRTSSLTKGTVTGIDASVLVGYGGRDALFVGQIIVESRKPFIKPGDSGSLLVTKSRKEPVGLLFAGNSTGQMAVANPIDDVLAAFGVTIDGKE